ncbi:hypothetical protein D3C80_1089100 [compost metagenome]|uniref:hypothetical protein n=1 Tax=Lelliottia amnigena TaxID=61646 RepID=UPI000FC2D463|nr:hypothetical protein [Lelliottia amnigena]MCG7782181.1 hypothetical protein [Lelliottia amnigena]
MTATKFALAWLFFSVVYVIIFAVIFAWFPEMGFWSLIRRHYHEFIPETKWNDFYTSVLLVVSLILNIAFIYLVFAVRRLIKKMPPAVP